MRHLRTIAGLFVLLLIVGVQCRAKCIVAPHEPAQAAPECPLHKKQAPEQAKCSHAPQWDLDDSRQVAILPDTAPLALVGAVEFAVQPRLATLPPSSIKPPRILRI